MEIKDGEAHYYPLTYDEYVQRADKAFIADTPKAQETVKKGYVRNFNYAKAVKQLEEKIAKLEETLEELRQLRFEPEYYHDFKKMNALDEQIDQVHVEIDHLMETWEEYSTHLE